MDRTDPTIPRRIVYLHGFASGPGSTKAMLFRQHFEPLGWRCDVPDLNLPSFSRLTVGGMVALIEATVAAVRGPVMLVGSSLGGYLASYMACRLESVAGLVLLAPAFDLRARWEARLGPEALAVWKRLGAIPVYHHGLHREEMLAYAFFEESAAYPAYPDVGRVPTLVFHGRRDQVIPVAIVESFARGKPNVTLTLLDDEHELIASSPQILAACEAAFSSWLVAFRKDC